MNYTESFRWWPNACAGGGSDNPGVIELYTDPLVIERITSLVVTFRMDAAWYAPAMSTLTLIPEISMDGTSWIPVTANNFGPLFPYSTVLDRKYFSVEDLARLMRYRISVELNSAGVFVATFDLSGLGHSGV